MENRSKKPSCPKCGVPPRRLHSEEMLLETATGRVIDGEAVQRTFICPQHGSFRGSRVTGHHGTIVEKKMHQLLPKRVHKTLLAKLEPEERKEFKEAFNGKRVLDNERVARWLRLVVAPYFGDEPKLTAIQLEQGPFEYSGNLSKQRSTK